MFIWESHHIQMNTGAALGRQSSHVRRSNEIIEQRRAARAVPAGSA
jgi:hypothetical protein